MSRETRQDFFIAVSLCSFVVIVMMVYSVLTTSVRSDRSPQSSVVEGVSDRDGKFCEVSVQKEIHNLRKLAQTYFGLGISISAEDISRENSCQQVLVAVRETLTGIFLKVGLSRNQSKEFLKELTGREYNYISDFQMARWFCNELKVRGDKKSKSLCEPMQEIAIVTDSEFVRFSENGPKASLEDIQEKLAMVQIDLNSQGESVGKVVRSVEEQILKSGSLALASMPSRAIADVSRSR